MWTDEAHIPSTVLQFSTRLIPLQSRPSQLLHLTRLSQLLHRRLLSQLFHRYPLSQLFRNFQTPTFPSHLIPLMSPIPPRCLGPLPH